MRVQLDPLAEITLEANPGTVDAGRFKAFRQAGVNRLSVGIQSFDERHLQALGRIHGRADAIAAAEAALTHFEAVNLDLMYALPGQSWPKPRPTSPPPSPSAPATCPATT
jgi:oxygen-independent coproporphyrinogen-3 oxidase